MRKLAFILLVLGGNSATVLAQAFELVDRQDNYPTGLSENLRIPIRIKNNSDRPQYYIIRKVSSDLGSTQKGYFCFDKNCLEAGIDEVHKRIEPGETLNSLTYTLETGLVTGQNNIRFEIFPRGTHDVLEHNITVTTEEKAVKLLVYKSKEIVVHDIYPNPAIEQASLEYQIHHEPLKAKVVIHNILGSTVGTYDMPAADMKVKIHTEELPPGVYFYTLYLNNEGVLTRKLIVRK
jgi:Secretion system C-terminal sorting domain